MGFAVVAMIAWWIVLVLTDCAVGFGFSFGVSDNVILGLMLGLMIAHLVSAPVAWVISIVVLMSAGRWVVGLLGMVAVPLAALISLGVAMTDAWGWNTAAARSAGLGSYLFAVALVAAGPLSLLALISAAIHEKQRAPVADSVYSRFS